MKIRATPISVGGIVLMGILLVTLVLAWIASRGPWHTPIQTAVFTFFFLLVLGYFVDAWSEKLVLKNGLVTFDSFLRKKVTVNVCAMDEVLVIHEGLNQERGIVSVIFRAANGRRTRLALGPLWKRSELESFLSKLESATGSCQYVIE